MKYVGGVVFLLLLAGGQLLGQKSTVQEAFRKYGLDAAAILDSNAKANAARYAFTERSTLVIDATKKVSEAQFDPSLPAGQQWKLVTVNGGTPSAADQKLFNKQHNVVVPAPRPDDASYKLVQEDTGTLVISFYYDPASLIDDNKFLAQCPVTLYINTATRRLQRSEMISTKPFKVKMFKADYMNTNITYQYDEHRHEYLPLREEVTLNLKILGRLSETMTINEYSGYVSK